MLGVFESEETVISLEQIKESLARIEANQANEIAARDLVWQSLGAVEKKLQGLDSHLRTCFDYVAEAQNKADLKLDAGLRATGDAVAGEIKLLRSQIGAGLLEQTKALLKARPLGKPSDRATRVSAVKKSRPR